MVGGLAALAFRIWVVTWSQKSLWKDRGAL